jgi:nitroimidazol reductase NimA-like FMN-containing flavoprotein (pyridoxamine 5'-phosphate oxidase superfamily)
MQERHRKAQRGWVGFPTIMIITAISDEECRSVFARGSIARLGCSLDNQPYILPIFYAYEPDSIYVFSTFGQKIEWMRVNPKVCVQVDEIANQANWVSVIANGTYQELPDSQDSVERNHARQLLEKQHQWWLNALAERRSQVDDLLIAPLFFRIQTISMTGLRARDSEKAAG